jgi:hypothetical protein
MKQFFEISDEIVISRFLIEDDSQKEMLDFIISYFFADDDLGDSSIFGRIIKRYEYESHQGTFVNILASLPEERVREYVDCMDNFRKCVVWYEFF